MPQGAEQSKNSARQGVKKALRNTLFALQVCVKRENFLNT